MKVKVTFTEEVLGSQPDPETWAKYLGSKSADAEKLQEEAAALPAEELMEKGTTTFYRFANKPALMDYQIKGFFKEACSMMSRVPDSISKELKAFKKIIDGLVMVYPRFIPLQGEVEVKPVDDMGQCPRPMRGQTPQGERVSLVNSETVPAGTQCEFEVKCLDPKHEKYVREWLNYGQFKGIGQWRNSGKGRFTWEEIEEAKSAKK